MIKTVWGEYTTAEAVVVASDARAVTLIVSKPATDTGECVRCGQCNPRRSASQFRLTIRPVHRYRVGSIIRIQWFSPGHAAAAAIVFGLPLAACATALFGWVAIDPTSVGSPRLTLVAMAGLACGFGMAVFLEHGARHLFPPRIISEDPA
jgi:hypothetical protein